MGLVLICEGRSFPSEKSSSAENDSWSRLSRTTEKLKSTPVEFNRERWGSTGTTSYWERSWENEMRGLATRLGSSERSSVAAMFSLDFLGRLLRC